MITGCSRGRLYRWLLLLGGLLCWGNMLTVSAESLAIIVNKQNPVSEISVKDLARVYLGHLSRWRDGQKIMVVHDKLNSEARNDFLRLVLAVSSEDVYQRQRKEDFQYLEVENAAEINRFIAKIPNAIGYSPHKDIGADVKTLTIDNYLPEQSGYPLQ